MITYKMYGSLAEADLTSSDSSEAPRVCVDVDSFVAGDDYTFVLASDGWWDVYFSREPSIENIKKVLAEMNHVAPSEIDIVPQTVPAK